MEGHCSPPWELLTGELVERVASLLPPNEVACTMRLINKSTARQLRGWTLVRLSQPAPHHAFVRRWGTERGMRDLSLQQRQQLLCLTARSGVIANLDIAIAAVGCPLTKQVSTAAVEAGHLEMCDWLVEPERGCPLDAEAAAKAAAKAGNMTALCWVLQRAGAHDPATRKAAAQKALLLAARGGHRALCEELLPVVENPYLEEAVWRAAEGGHEDLVYWLLDELDKLRVEIEHKELLMSAVYGFELSALQRLFDFRLGSMVVDEYEEFKEDSGWHLVAAAIASPGSDWRAKLEWLDAEGIHMQEGGLEQFMWLDMLDWEPLPKLVDAVERVVLLREQRLMAPRATAGLCSSAIAVSSLPVVQLLLSAEGALGSDDDMVAAAAEVGNVDVLLQLLATGLPMTLNAAKRAARRGHLHVLQRLLLEGPDAVGPAAAAAAAEVLQAALQDPGLMKCGAESGSLEMVVWLRERGCPWDADAFEGAADSGNAAMLEWMAAQGCPMGSTGEAYLKAGRNGDFATLRCLRRLGCPWGPDSSTFNRAIYNGGNNNERNAPYCSLPVLSWLVTEGCPVNWHEARVMAALREDEEVRAWVESNP
ncbi:hypothetical protein PLESTB_001720600 [Pleodorina starrii]|uniref:Ankyrin repeat domain-containing protein n=1 Tax=Pleodorina starrii TaxID=330485 RepID=A0A9W6F9V1_9CHLO|nr:hypothetical protein PLESTB_001720600 [Pleodorina starrii]